jgi:hypothetical protein
LPLFFLVKENVTDPTTNTTILVETVIENTTSVLRPEPSDSYLDVATAGQVDFRDSFTISVWANPKSFVSYNPILSVGSQDEQVQM